MGICLLEFGERNTITYLLQGYACPSLVTTRYSWKQLNHSKEFGIFTRNIHRKD